MKVWLSLIVSIVALAATPAIAMAGPDSVHYGPINSATPDSGTGGNNWANDTFKRVFDAATKPNTDGTYNVTETFIAGRFVTVAGPSPNGCDAITGTGVSFVVVVSGGTFDPTATCESGCDTTDGFVATVYGSRATHTVTSFGFDYHANGPDLIQREWHNASPDQGGNFGDIRSS